MTETSEIEFSGRMLVLKAVASTEGKPFRPTDIVYETGLSRQNVNNHLKRLIALNCVEKHNSIYMLTNLPALIDVLATPQSKVTVKLQNTKIYSKAREAEELIRLIVLAKSLDLEGAQGMKDTLNTEITKTIAQFKNMRHKLNTSVVSRDSALRKLEKDSTAFEQEWVENTGEFGVVISPSKLHDQILDRVEEARE